MAVIPMDSSSGKGPTPEPGASPSQSWIDLFVQYTEGLPAPEIFRRWCGITAVSGALERRVWVRTASLRLFPNLFSVLVAPPGVGKSVAIDEVVDLWANAGCFKVAPASLTRAAFIDTLKESTRTLTIGKEIWMYHSLLVPSSEFGVLMTGHDLEFMNTLNRVFDCPEVFEARTRGGGEIKIDKPHMVLLAGTQPKYLGEIFPEAAFGLGFTSRLIMVYAGDPIKVSLFNGTAKNWNLRRQLIASLQDLSNRTGELAFTTEAAAEIESWHDAGCPPAPTHHKLMNYSTRRIMHVLKLSTIFACSRGSDVIDTEDFANAKDHLLEAEGLMPEIFKEVTSGSQVDQIEECYNFCVLQYNKTKKPIPAHMLVHFLSRRVPASQISWILNAMIEGNYIVDVANGTTTRLRLFKPVSPSERSGFV